MKTSDFQHYLDDQFGINPTESYTKFVIKDLESRCLRDGKEITIHHMPFYDADKGVLYINQNNGFMYVLDGVRVELPKTPKKFRGPFKISIRPMQFSSILEGFDMIGIEFNYAVEFSKSFRSHAGLLP